MPLRSLFVPLLVRLFVRSTSALGVVAITALVSTTAQAGPLSTMYLTSWSDAALFTVQGGNVTGTASTYCNHCEQPIAVYGDIRTIGSGNGFGGRYKLDLSQTATTYAQPVTPSLTDGTTDGQRNYAVAAGYDGNQPAVYVFDRDWSNPTVLFQLAAGTRALGITYDPTNNSLWLQGEISSITQQGDPISVLQDYDLGGNLLSSVANLGGGALAMDYADNSLWVVRGPMQYFDQYDRNGVLMQTTTYDSLVGKNGIGAEFNLAEAPAAVPEPGSLGLAGTALAGLALVRRSRRHSVGRPA